MKFELWNSPKKAARKKTLTFVICLFLSFSQLAMTSARAQDSNVIFSQSFTLKPGQHQMIPFSAPAVGEVQVSTQSSSTDLERDYTVTNSLNQDEQKNGHQSGVFDVDNFLLNNPAATYTLEVWLNNPSAQGTFTLTVRSYDPNLGTLQLETPVTISIDQPREQRKVMFTAPANGIIQVITRSTSKSSGRTFYVSDSLGNIEANPRCGPCHPITGVFSVDNVVLKHPGQQYTITAHMWDDFNIVAGRITQWPLDTGSFTLLIRTFDPTSPGLVLNRSSSISIASPGEYRTPTFTAPASGEVYLASQSKIPFNYDIYNSYGEKEFTWGTDAGLDNRKIDLKHPGDTYLIQYSFLNPIDIGKILVEVATNTITTPLLGSGITKPTPIPLSSPSCNGLCVPAVVTGALNSPSDVLWNNWFQALPVSDPLAGICNDKICSSTEVPKIAVITHDPDSGAVLPVIAFPAASNISNLYSQFNLYVYEYKDSKLSWQASQQNLIPKNVTRGNTPFLTSFFHWFKKGKDGVEVIWDVHNTYRAILTAHDLNGKTVILASAEDHNTTVNTACQWRQLGLFVLKDGIKVSPQLVSVSASTISDVVSGLSSQVTNAVINQLPIPAPLKSFTKAERKEILDKMFKTSLSEVQLIGLFADLADTAISVHQSFVDGKINGEGVLGIAATITHVGAAKLLGDSRFSKSTSWTKVENGKRVLNPAFINPGTEKFLTFVGLTSDIEGMYQVAARMNNLVQDANKTINMKCVKG